MRRTRLSLPPLALLTVLVVFAGPAAAPLAADPTPAPARVCALSCSAAYQACAKERCDSSARDEDVACLKACQGDYLGCVDDCQ